MKTSYKGDVTYSQSIFNKFIMLFFLKAADWMKLFQVKLQSNSVLQIVSHPNLLCLFLFGQLNER